jgi:hypothetical protein
MIIVAGDIHMDFGALNTLISKRQPSIILSVGDWGYWPRMSPQECYGVHKVGFKAELPKPKSPRTKIYWCDGNHEDHVMLNQRTTDELWPNVFYMPRASTLVLPDGRKVLFMGGADSHDKAYRTPGISWFPEELITQADMDRLPKCKVDIVISHTCPCEWVPGVMNYDVRMGDPCRHALSLVLRQYRPKLWYFGHWHRNVTCYDKEWDCRWTALDHTGGLGRWWEELRA